MPGASDASGAPPLRVEVELELRSVAWTPAASIELRALFDGQRHVVDVPFHASRGLQRNRHGANDPGDAPAHDHALGGDGAGHFSLVADDELGAGHVAFDFAVDLQCPATDDLEALADDLEIVADHRLAAGVRWARA